MNKQHRIWLKLCESHDESWRCTGTFCFPSTADAQLLALNVSDSTDAAVDLHVEPYDSLEERSLFPQRAHYRGLSLQRPDLLPIDSADVFPLGLSPLLTGGAAPAFCRASSARRHSHHSVSFLLKELVISWNSRVL